MRYAPCAVIARFFHAALALPVLCHGLPFPWHALPFTDPLRVPGMTFDALPVAPPCPGVVASSCPCLALSWSLPCIVTCLGLGLCVALSIPAMACHRVAFPWSTSCALAVPCNMWAWLPRNFRAFPVLSLAASACGRLMALCPTLAKRLSLLWLCVAYDCASFRVPVRGCCVWALSWVRPCAYPCPCACPVLILSGMRNARSCHGLASPG